MSRRSTFHRRAGVRVSTGAAYIAPPSAPVISGTVTIGGTLTITPGAGGGPVTSYTLYRDGVSAGTITSPYTPVRADVYPTLTVKAVGPGGTSAASNTLTWAVPAGRTTQFAAAGISGSPIDSWANAGSAGGSVSATLTTRPAQATINGLTCADFDGSNDVMTGGPALSNIIKSDGSRYTVCAVMRPDALTGASTSGFNMRAMVADATNGVFYPILTDTSGILGGHFQVTDHKTAEIAVSAGTVYYVEVSYDGTNIVMRCNGTSQSVAAGSIATLTGLLKLGANYASAVFIDATLAEMWIFNVKLSSGDLADCQAYLLNRFPSAVAAF